MATLERTEACGFSIELAHTIAELEEMTMEQRQDLLIPTEHLFDDLPPIKLSEFYERLIRNGCAVQQKKLKCNFPALQRVRLYDPTDTFFALGEVVDTDDGLSVKAIKTFVLA